VCFSPLDLNYDCNVFSVREKLPIFFGTYDINSIVLSCGNCGLKFYPNERNNFYRFLIPIQKLILYIIIRN